ncbi:hypothetical protein ACM46_11460 [Chryseobacterium angstadtii]|uniref:Porin n=1 Tax=Chryseobacterium angstadtii TaxID=558151 RepID=A0A0J7IFU7_9FLAO|nr:porin [Chryseobacterium angstadtii]KMQ64831.1 hypothetical protein ACM46_11460 [Chryseobacterium angstadtii]
MKKIAIYIALIFFCTIDAQKKKTENTANFELGSGLNFSFEDNNYRFTIGGFLQPAYTYSKITDKKGTNELNVQRAYFSLGGKAVKEKISFFIQTDFSLSQPLLDAWLAYHPTENISITAGQKRTPLNNKEMNINESQFQFTERSLLSTSLTNTGREFGLFADGRFQLGSFGIIPQLAMTSGDGRNSFGSNSRDTDRGGLKYGARLDLYPLGFFSEGNEEAIADLLHEPNLRIAAGAAASYNKGVSSPVGEGHGDFSLYDAGQKLKYPDYRKFYADLLLKYKGFSLLGEYANANATALDGIYTNQTATDLLRPQQISSYLVLGDAYNVQLGYVTLNGWAADLRYSRISPEFKDFENSVMKDVSAYTLGLTKYIKGNNLKIQAAVSSLQYTGDINELKADLVFQIVF